MRASPKSTLVLLNSKHSLQNTKNFYQRGIRQNPQAFNQTLPIDCLQLISNHMTGLRASWTAH